MNNLAAMNNGSTMPLDTLLEFCPTTSLTLISGSQQCTIPFEEITHISKSGWTTVVHTVSGPYLTFLPLQTILRDLPVNEFFRVHKSHIVSCRHISRINGCCISVGDNCLPLSGYFRQELLRGLARQLDRIAIFFDAGK